MNQKLRFFMLALLCAVLNVAWGADETITFSELYTQDTPLNGVTIQGTHFAIKFAKNSSQSEPKYYTNGSSVRAYYQNSFTVFSEKKIEKIEITFGSSDGTNEITTGEDGTYKDGVWSGESKSVTFTVGGSSGQRRIKAVAVTFVNESGLKDPLLSFTDGNSITLTLGDNPYTNTIISNSDSGDPLGDLTINYEALAEDGESETDVVSVNNTGAVTVSKSGKAIIKASWAEVTGKWRDGSIQYSVTVNKKTAVIQPIDNMALVKEGTKDFIVTTNSDGDITVSSSPESIATVTSSGNTYTVKALAMGIATITVSQAASETFNATSVAFTVEVTEPGILFYESFDKATKNSKGTDIIGGNDNPNVEEEIIWSGNAGNVDYDEDLCDNKGWDMQGSPKMGYQCIKLGTGTAKGSATTPALKATGDAILTFKAGAWNANGENVTLILSVSGGAELSKKSVTLEKGEWTEYEVTVTNLKSESKISFSAENALKNRFFLDEVKLAQSSPATITATFNPKYKGFTSIYYKDKNLKVPANVTAHTYKVVKGKGEYTTNIATDGVIPAGTPVILEYGGTFVNDTDPVEVTFEEVATADPLNNIENMLRGSDGEDENEMTTGPESGDYYFYVLSVGQGEEAGKIGFYWKVADGAAFKPTPHKAYLALKQSDVPGANASMVSISDTNGINNISANNDSTQNVYTLSGIRVNGKDLPKGIYVIGGKKVVVK